MKHPQKILFVGLGGAGQRHLRIFRDVLPENVELIAYRQAMTTPLLRADFTPDTTSSIEVAYDVKLFNSIEEALEKSPDLVVISTPTACHREVMLKAAESGCGIFVEKPWAENLLDFKKFRNLVESQKLPFNISFQRRFHPLIKKAREFYLSGYIGKPLVATFKVFSNVRDWHPYEDWSKLYAVQRKLGGGVLLTEIHEIDLAYWFFGLPDSVFCSGGNYSGYSLDVEDTAQLILDYQEYSVGISLCFMHEQSSRSFHIVGTKGEIRWDSLSNRLVVDSNCSNMGKQIYELNYTNDQMFVDQAEKFLTNWGNKDTTDALNAAACSLKIVEAAHLSMKTRKSEVVNLDNIT